MFAETAFVTAAVTVAVVSGHPYTGAVRFTLIALLALGLGVQSAAARALSVPDLKTTELTLTGIVADSRLAKGRGAGPAAGDCPPWPCRPARSSVRRPCWTGIRGCRWCSPWRSWPP
ncbi:hypothetical protein ACFWVP_08750 [Streptomyces sp. NPDC058637]|uniref:hypothetical protein n=1 Tax=Streptomyces sp. NPDC058637 TaxID=3346569 RepID=UPI003665D5F5